jgi:hypothetical protein
MFAPFVLCAALLAVGALPTRTLAQGPAGPLVEVVDITVESVEVIGGELIATLEVTLDVLGRTIVREVQVPLDVGGSPGAEGECDILNLALGPVHLDLLGLVVDLDDCEGGPITVDITANPEGGLLGDLLCGIAGLLDSGVPLAAVLEGLSAEELALFTGGIEDVLNAVLDEVLMANPRLPAMKAVVKSSCSIFPAACISTCWACKSIRAAFACM